MRAKKVLSIYLLLLLLSSLPASAIFESIEDAGVILGCKVPQPVLMY